MRGDDQPAGAHAVFVSAVVVAAITALDISKMNIGLFSIQTALGGSTASIQLIVSGYALAFGVALLPAGRWGDVRSRRGPLLAGLTILGVASLVGALAWSVELVVVVRVVQGIAAGMMMPQALGIVQDQFHGPQRARMYGVLGAAIAVATAIGPALGGLAIAVAGPDIGWRLLFLMNVPAALLAIYLARRATPRVERPAEPPELDLVGIALIATSTLLVMLPFMLDRPWGWVAFPAAAVGICAFVMWERRYVRGGRAPAVDLTLFHRGTFRLAMVVGLCYMASVSNGVLLIVLYAQQRLQLSAPLAGLMTVPFAILAFGLSWLGGRWAGHHLLAVTTWGLIACLGGSAALGIVLLAVPVEWQWLANPAAFSVGGIGLGLLTASTQTLVLLEVAPDRGGVASSLGQVVQRLGTAIGPTIGFGVYAGVLRGGGDPPVAFAAALVVSAAFATVALLVTVCFRATRPRRTA